MKTLSAKGGGEAFAVLPQAARSSRCANRMALGLLCCGFLLVSSAEVYGSPAELQAYSVQLHVHGPFSERLGSIDSHSYEASALGLDVIWWTDHDHRIASYRHVARFGFEAFAEPIDRGESWKVRSLTQRTHNRHFKRLIKRSGRPGEEVAEFVSVDPREGDKSLRITSSSHTSEFSSHVYSFETDRGLQRRPLASRVTLAISIFPEQLGPDTEVGLEVGISEHAPRQGLPLQAYTLHYFLDNQGGKAYRNGTTYHIPLAYRPGEWNDYKLPLSVHASRGFPFTNGEDNNLNRLELIAGARNGATVSVRFDALQIEQEIRGSAAFAAQRRLIDAVAKDYPSLHQLQGVEISYARRHLNEYSSDPRLLDYDAIYLELRGRAIAQERGLESFQDLVTARAVELAHARGGLISFNHMFGVAYSGTDGKRSRDQTFENLRASRVYGADLLEVGYRARGGHGLRDHLWVWDQLARAGIRIVGVGVSDSHGGPGQRWRSAPNNFVSWVYAASSSTEDLLAGLRAGRVFFGDLVHFDGRVELTTAAGARMGESVAIESPSSDVKILLDGVEVGDRIVVVEATGNSAEFTATGARFERWIVVAHEKGVDGFVRVEVHDKAGEEKVYSNPIYFVHETTAD